MTTYPRTSSTFPERRLERACQYVSDMWFPANPTLVVKLRHSLAVDNSPDLEAFVADLKGDYSLFLFCLRELLQLLRQEGVKPPLHLSPLELFKWGGVERLRAILSLDDAPGSRHNFGNLTAVQQERLEEMVISTSAAQVLARQSHVEENLGFSAALMRQLGLTLIAWNYPEAYQRALEMLSEEITLDAALTRILGFSPTLLGITLARKWGVSPDICLAMIDDDEPLEAEEAEWAVQNSAISHTLATLCRVGEALARANAPEVYPNARNDWEVAKVEIQARLGNEGLEMIQAAVEETCDNYITSIPTLFKGGSLLDPETRLESYEQEHLITRNPYVERCRAYLKKKLQDLYAAIQRNEGAHATLRTLMREIIPESGYSGGIVYALEPTSEFLVAQLRIGTPVLRGMAQVSLDPRALSGELVIQAYLGDETVCHGVLSEDGTGFTCVAGFLGCSQRFGVLYLEIPDLVFKGSEEHHLTHFKAFCLAINDCLALR